MGALILHPNSFIKKLPNYFDVESLDDPKHREVFNFVLDKVFNDGVEDIDYVELHKETGIGYKYIGELMDIFWHDVYYLNFDAMLETWISEAKIKADTQRLEKNLREGKITATEYYQEIEEMVEEYKRGSQDQKPSLTDKKICDEYVSKYQDKDAQTFLTGLGLDDWYKFRRQEVTVIGALNKIGKSLFALFLGMKFSSEGSVFYVSTEMGETDYAERSLAYKTNLNSERIRDKKLTEEERAFLKDGLTAGKDNVFFECYTRKLIEIEKRVSIIRPDVLIVDHLQDLQNPDKIKDEEEGIAANMRALKLMAIKNNMVVVVMSQLSRVAEEKKDLFSYMLRGSGVIEQVADGIILIRRDVKTQPNSACFKIDRSRHGQSGIEVEISINFTTANFY